MQNKRAHRKQQRALRASPSTVVEFDRGVPVRENPFFTHLNCDIRAVIYDDLDLPPFSHEALELLLSCRESLEEVGAEEDQLHEWPWRYVRTDGH
jgi:hypothetical protein